MTWYQKLITCIEVVAYGAVANVLKGLLSTGLFSQHQSVNIIDPAISSEVTSWFRGSFQPWFQDITKKLEAVTDPEVLASEQYKDQINDMITALHVSRAYYSKKADQATLLSSIQEVAELKSAICLEAAEAIRFAYLQVLKQYGATPKERVHSTDASSFTGSTPEEFRWPGTVIANHKIFAATANQPQEQPQEQPQLQPQQQSEKSIKHCLPWVVAAFFGLIAWSAAAKE